jgi:hypothetical protein
MPTDQDYDDDFDDLDDLDDADGPGLPWPPTEYPGFPPPPRRRRGALFAVTAVLAALAGFGVVAVALHDVTSSGTPSGTSSTPAGSAPSPSTIPGGNPQNLLPQSGGGGGALLPPGAGAGQELLQIEGQVTAVTPTSITIGGAGRSVTAAITAATKFTGKVSRVSGVKAGDLVAAVITGADGKLTAETIQDPASAP